MNNFNFLCDTKFIFGKETEKTVGSEIKQYGKKVLFVNDGGDYLKTTGFPSTSATVVRHLG